MRNMNGLARDLELAIRRLAVANTTLTRKDQVIPVLPLIEAPLSNLMTLVLWRAR